MTVRNKIFHITNRIGIPTLLRNFKGESVTVLSLHRVSEERDFFFDPIDPKTFKKLIEYCLKNYEIISFSTINKKTNKPKLILSFDDGYYDFMEYVIPVLKNYGLPCNHNLVNSCLNNNTVIWTQKLNDIFSFLKDNSIINDEIINTTGTNYSDNWYSYNNSCYKAMLKLNFYERNLILKNLANKYNIHSKYRMMNWEDVKLCLEKHDVEIGCHTYNHDSLFTLNSKAELDIEIGKSIDEMENNLNAKINVLALPNGQYNENVIDYARKKNIEYLLLVDDKINLNNKLNSEFNLISRINLINENINEMILRTELFHTKLRKFI